MPRWFDNYAHRVSGGMLTIRNFRFGGESKGITAVVNFAPFVCGGAARRQSCAVISAAGGMVV